MRMEALSRTPLLQKESAGKRTLHRRQRDHNPLLGELSMHVPPQSTGLVRVGYRLSLARCCLKVRPDDAWGELRGSVWGDSRIPLPSFTHLEIVLEPTPYLRPTSVGLYPLFTIAAASWRTLGMYGFCVYDMTRMLTRPNY